MECLFLPLLKYYKAFLLQTQKHGYAVDRAPRPCSFRHRAMRGQFTQALRSQGGKSKHLFTNKSKSNDVAPMLELITFILLHAFSRSKSLNLNVNLKFPSSIS